ncbi:MatE (Na+-driven multidrug efflux pump) domain protein [Metarhizium robertsii]|uniref:Multi antimicrobial extrusion protein n=2 Tax=Metarhizium robertsii TaxID=568076 RepID=E9F1Q6_METRA|nr:Multi antimicrobial extrusion protein [Metarhizium robertsii ARSEF 23]EFY98428.1 Multi antimicrobial extrusion protein [Metarhizium robertsii ARSEF 23]EXV01832.1 MatE (Na+-driven multidrug efflux pump) domain protein [Metarhizium robertsii]
MEHGRSMGTSPSRRDVLSSSAQQRFLSSSPLAGRFLAEDIAACSDDDYDDTVIEDQGEAERPSHLMYRRPSGVAYGGTRPVFNAQPIDEPILTPMERRQSRHAERSLLRDNHVLPPKHANQKQRPSFARRLYNRLFSTKLPREAVDEESPEYPPTETSPLLNGHGHGQGVGSDAGSGSGSADDGLEQQWEEAIASGRLQTTWQRETKTIVAYSWPLIITFALQYSINVTSIFAVGRIGRVELGAVSLANMSQAISCLAPFQGLATSLDTLCAQAYGSGHKHLVGLQCQRMACFLMFMSLPVAILWLFADRILVHVVPDAETARLAALYLKVMIASIPGIILFEVGKRFTQAQGLFRATTYVLLVAAPINIFINWLLVWRLGLGFVGAPIAVAITESLLPILLLLYIVFVDGRQCWGGFSKRIFSNWWIMIKLALPGMIMVEAEWFAFEIMTLLAGQLGTEYLAAQSVLVTLSSISYQMPFPMSIAASTRVANLMGAGLVDAAKIAGKVTFVLASILGALNVTIFSSLRFHLPILFTNDPEVIKIVASVLPLVAVMQLFDGLGAGAHGLLRGIGKQSIGGPANLISYYVISLPISLGLAFGLGWNLDGLWIGLTIGLALVSVIEYTYLLHTDWHKAALEAEARNAAG